MNNFAVVYDGELVALFSNRDDADLFNRTYLDDGAGKVVSPVINPVLRADMPVFDAWRVQIDDDGDIQVRRKQSAYDAVYAAKGKKGYDPSCKGRYVAYVFSDSALHALDMAMEERE